jgi:hypothetical protein
VTEDALEDEDSIYLEAERSEEKRSQQQEITGHQLAFHNQNLAKIKMKNIDFSDPNQHITIRAPDRVREGCFVQLGFGACFVRRLILGP